MRTEKTRMLRSGEVAKRLGLHPLTVRRWVKEGKIAAVQIGREARIPITEVERLLGEQRAGIVVLYGRVSGHDQKDDLQRQVQQLEQWAQLGRTGQKTMTLTDIGSGLNTERKSLQRLLALVQQIETVERKRPKPAIVSLAVRPQQHQLLRLLIRQRPQQKSTGNGEDGGIAPNAQHKDGNRSQSKARTLAQRAPTIADVLQRKHSLSL